MAHPTSTSSIDVLYAGGAVAERLSNAADRLSVRRIETAAAALTTLADRPVDCVVSDAVLPGTGALAFFDAVHDARPDLPFVLVVDPAADALVGDALAAGVTDCVHGTAPADLLAHRIGEAVESHRPDRRRRRTERAQYRRLFADAPVMYAAFRDVDDEPVVEDCNDRFLDRLGYDRDAVVGRPVWDFYGDESRTRAVDGFDSGREGTFGQQERTLVAADGERVATIFRASPRVDEYGDVIGTIGLYVDITDRKRRERTLERLHDVTRNLLRAETETEVAEIITDAVRDVLGYPTNLVRLLDGDQLHPVAVSEAAERTLGDRPVYRIGEGIVGRAFASGEPLLYDDVSALDDDYDRGDARASMVVPIGDHGVLSVGHTAVGTFDHSDRHLAGVFAANADTALTLLDRTRDLERQNARLEEFASVVSHDLRTPLSVVDGSLELARAQYDDETLDRAARSLDRAFGLIEDLLALARRDDDPDFRPVDLAAVAEECWATADTAEATLVVAGDCRLRADESRLRRLLENLFRNSVEHGATDALTVTVGPLDDGFYVADDGVGLPDGRDVFDAGYTTDAGGTGLGLAIVERIAREHGWSVDAREADGGGARFEFRR